MKEPLKVGDLVRQRGTERRFVIVDIEGVHAFVQLKGTDRKWGTLHIELLKRLKPKRKAREFWLAFVPGQFTRAMGTEDAARSELKNSYQSPSAEIIHVREVRPKP